MWFPWWRQHKKMICVPTECVFCLLSYRFVHPQQESFRNHTARKTKFIIPKYRCFRVKETLTNCKYITCCLLCRDTLIWLTEAERRIYAPVKYSSDNGLSPGRHQSIILNNAGILLIGPLETNLSEILIEIDTFSFKNMYLKMSSGRWSPYLSRP